MTAKHSEQEGTAPDLLEMARVSLPETMARCTRNSESDAPVP